MAVTLTEQWRVWPPGGSEIEWLVDGEGMHSNVPYDLVRELNNIGSYACGNWAQFVYNSDAATDITITPIESGEYFMMQFPVVIPRGAVRMLWTGAITNGASTTLSACTVYLSATPNAMGDLFDITQISPQYQSHAVTQTVSTAIYSLFADSTTGLTNVDGLGGFALSNTGWAQIAYLVFTVTVASAGGTAITMRDFTCWFLYE